MCVHGVCSFGFAVCSSCYCFAANLVYLGLVLELEMPFEQKSVGLFPNY